MTDAQTAKKKDFVEIKFSGYANNQLFDSNIPEDLKTLAGEKAKPEKTIICIGERMLVEGLDKQLEGKNLGKEYEIEVSSKEGFGDRNRNLLKIIPLKAFSEQKVHPQVGMMFTLDNSLVKVIAVSGARVTVDFNNPLAGKDLRYKITIVRKVEDTKEKTETIFQFFFRFVPELEVKDKIIVKGKKILGQMISPFNDKFKELVGMELAFEEKLPEKNTVKEEEEEKEEEISDNKEDEEENSEENIQEKETHSHHNNS